MARVSLIVVAILGISGAAGFGQPRTDTAGASGQVGNVSVPGAGIDAGSIGGPVIGVAGADGAFNANGSIPYSPTLPEEYSPVSAEPASQNLGGRTPAAGGSLTRVPQKGASAGKSAVAPVKITVQALPKDGKASPPGSFEDQTRHLFEGSIDRPELTAPGGRTAAENPPQAEEFADSKLPLPGRPMSIRKKVAMAGQVGPINVPSFYQDAINEAEKRFERDPLKFRETRADIVRIAEHRAPSSVKLLIEQAITSASLSADSAAEDIVRQSKRALEDWNRLLGAGSRPFIANIDEIKRAIDGVLAEAKANPDLPVRHMSATMNPAGNSEAGSFVIALREIQPMPEKVGEISKNQFDSFDLAARFRAGDGFSPASLAALRDAFLEPPAHVDFMSAYRNRRHGGSSFASAFLIAFRDWSSGQAHYVWKRLQRAGRTLLRLFGISPPVLISQADVQPNAELERLLPQEPVIKDIQGTKFRVVAAPASPAAANMVVGIEQAGAAIKMQVLDQSEKSWRNPAGLLSPGMQALIRSARRADPPMQASWILKDEKVWGRIRAGGASAQVHGKFTSSDQGGMVRIVYEEGGIGPLSEARRYFVARVLFGLGFSLGNQGGALTASIDKNVAPLGPEALMDAYAAAVEAIRETEGFDYLLRDQLKGWPSVEENGRRLDELADIFLAEGRLPHDIHEYLSREGARESALIENNRRLVALGLPEIPPAHLEGERTRERFYVHVVDAAIARGELKQIFEDGRLRVARVRDFDAMARMLDSLPAPAALKSMGAGTLSELPPVRIAAVDESLAGELLLKFRTIGKAGGLIAEQAQTMVDSSLWLTVTHLRDPQTGKAAFARSDFWLKRAGDTGVSQPAVSVKELTRVLADHSLAAPGFQKISAAELAQAQRKLLIRAAPQGGDSPVFYGRALGAPGKGPIRAKLTFDPVKAMSGDAVWATPYVANTKTDSEAAARAAGIILLNSDRSDAVVKATENGIVVISFSADEWGPFGPELKSPIFAPAARSARGFLIQRVTGYEHQVPTEGREVVLNPSNASLSLTPEPSRRK